LKIIYNRGGLLQVRKEDSLFSVSLVIPQTTNPIKLEDSN